MPKPAPLCPEAPHLAAYTLERLAADLAASEGENRDQLRIHDVTIALQRLIGALGGDAAELRLIALLGAPADYLFGESARCIAHARALAAADVAQPAQVAA